MLTTEELMMPRVKCMGAQGKAHYPGSDHMVGDIISGQACAWLCYTLPHLFQLIPWYAERKAEELPMYVSGMTPTRVFKVKKYHFDKDCIEIIYDDLGKSDIRHLYLFTPATLEDYNDYINSQKV